MPASKSSSPSFARIGLPKTPGWFAVPMKLPPSAIAIKFRKSGDPYLIHLLEVAHILADMRLDATTLTAALLHDVIEDTEFPVVAHQ